MALPSRGADSTSVFDVNVLKAANIIAVGRYLTLLTKGEVDNYRNNGIGLWLNIERGAAALKKGSAEGASQAAQGHQLATALGIPNNVPIYLSADFEAFPGDYDVVEQALRGAKGAMPREVGLYGNGALLEEMSRRGAAQWCWQSMSTSFPGNQSRSPVAHIRQLDHHTFPMAGNWDEDELWQTDVGQYPRPQSPNLMSLTVLDTKHAGVPAGRVRFIRLKISPGQFQLVSFNGAKISGYTLPHIQPSNGAVLGVEAEPDGIHFVVTADDGGTFRYAFVA